jgi:hypothetical protein
VAAPQEGLSSMSNVDVISLCEFRRSTGVTTFLNSSRLYYLPVAHSTQYKGVAGLNESLLFMPPPNLVKGFQRDLGLAVYNVRYQ